MVHGRAIIGSRQSGVFLTHSQQMHVNLSEVFFLSCSRLGKASIAQQKAHTDASLLPRSGLIMWCLGSVKKHRQLFCSSSWIVLHVFVDASATLIAWVVSNETKAAEANAAQLVAQHAPALPVLQCWTVCMRGPIFEDGVVRRPSLRCCCSMAGTLSRPNLGTRFITKSRSICHSQLSSRRRHEGG